MRTRNEYYTELGELITTLAKKLWAVIVRGLYARKGMRPPP